MHLHLDPLGGVAGDMFSAAILDAWPEMAPGLQAAFAGAGLDRIAAIVVAPHRDHALTGTRFSVRAEESGHHHRHHREIRELLGAADIAAGVRERALDMFMLLARAEGRVHGVDPDNVGFHEVGAWDSIADVVSAAWLIDALGNTTWSCEPLPMGRGRVNTAHGELPLPVPATALLLEGYPLRQDRFEGERVTPTGAAIIRHLDPSFDPIESPMTLERSGTGFGTRTFDGMSNILRVLAMRSKSTSLTTERIAVCQFEVDDQSPEDLAVGLERLRGSPGVVDVLQSAVHAKKGRIAVQVQLLADPASLEASIERCFTETRTLGVRWQIVQRSVLERSQHTAALEGAEIRVKRALRPGAVTTAKAEMDDLAHTEGGYAGRERVRRAAEAAALDADREIPEDA